MPTFVLIWDLSRRYTVKNIYRLKVSLMYKIRWERRENMTLSSTTKDRWVNFTGFKTIFSGREISINRGWNASYDKPLIVMRKENWVSNNQSWSNISWYSWRLTIPFLSLPYLVMIFLATFSYFWPSSPSLKP